MNHLVTAEDIQIARLILSGYQQKEKHPTSVDQALAYELYKEWLSGDRICTDTFLTKFDHFLNYLIELDDKPRSSRAFDLVLFRHGISIPIQYLKNWRRFTRICGTQISVNAWRKSELTLN